MGKVNALWQEEREKHFQELKKSLLTDGFKEHEAHQYAAEMLHAEDEANGQFGVGA